MNRRLRLALLLALCALLAPRHALAQAGGFQLNHYEPTMPGAWFLTVEHPWYSSTRYFAAGVTLDYNHNPLIFGHLNSDGNFTQSSSVIAHQLVGHLDIAASLADRVNLSATLPITLVEAGQAQMGVSPSSPNVGDPRIGLHLRIWGQPDKDPFSIHVAGNLWVPIGAASAHAGDKDVRVAPKLLLAGMIANHIRWSANAAYVFRTPATIGTPPTLEGASVGQELQIGLAAQYTNSARRWALGPELSLATITSTPEAVKKPTVFDRDFTSLELLFSGHYQIIRELLLSAGAGFGVLRDPGTPDFRLLVRLAYAPVRQADSDKDGIPDESDACPTVKGVRTQDPKTNGCPPDRDHDGVPDVDDLCPDVPRGDKPDVKRPGCPLLDRDGDGFYDDVDQCIDVPAGPFPDPKKPGCPLPDRDKDTIPDEADLCPDVPMGDNPDPTRLGCPIEKPKTDRDQDGIFDVDDKCPDVPAGLHPDPEKLGCPLLDSDGDGIPDVSDACPTKPGAPDPDPKKNGCPGLVQIKDGKIMILAPVFFATDRDIILAKSFPVLTAVVNALKGETGIKRVAIEGHTDSKGNFAHNMDLSERRAKSVMKWLNLGGIAPERLEAHGYGPTHPIDTNKTNKGRAKNRRVDFLIVDPSPSGAPKAGGAATPAATPEAAPAEAPFVPTGKALRGAKRGHGKAGKLKGAKGPKAGGKAPRKRRGH